MRNSSLENEEFQSKNIGLTRMPKPNIFIEKRTHSRVKINLPVKYRLIEERTVLTTARDLKRNDHTSHTLNISSGGLFLATGYVSGGEGIIRLEISIPEIPYMITAFTEIVWSNETGVGLHFEAIKEEDVEVLHNFLSMKALRNTTL
jgi:hypothetical protein